MQSKKIKMFKYYKQQRQNGVLRCEIFAKTSECLSDYYVLPVLRYISTITEVKRVKETLTKIKNGVLNNKSNFETNSNEFSETIF